jgi:hypothetical protein
MAVQAPEKLTKKQIESHAGLRLPPDVVQLLGTTRIQCNPGISIVHQHLAGRYVLRGQESGGAVHGIGAYCSYVDEVGKPLSWLQPVDTVGVNGPHALVIAPSLVRVQMVRVEHTYELLMTRHSLKAAPDRSKPALESFTLFRGRRGTLALDLWDKDSSYKGRICPVFYSYSGEPLTIPSEFAHAVVAVTEAVCCVGCRHSHLLQPAVATDQSRVAG